MITLKNLEVLEPLSDKDDVVGGLVIRGVKIIFTIAIEQEEETIPLAEKTISLVGVQRENPAGLGQTRIEFIDVLKPSISSDFCTLNCPAE
ncbi:hypothetical protein BJP34_35730 (plasmid) [Moorena producens PAL-8-15-08-1]|uniref:Uncharacterized protein n=1 Tax=Moorena producens PAL-8-15-08-1 TaxID=1458985 RepID=A0A1D8U4A7_9CYAN|nr:hypothetical protein [Moorena producens]AOX04732.1 hypothetical protein BJP34_35730 [Moorena producens PAL-8-15-08-1]